MKSKMEIGYKRKNKKIRLKNRMEKLFHGCRNVKSEEIEDKMEIMILNGISKLRLRASNQ